MNIFIFLIIILVGINIILYVFNTISMNFRKQKSNTFFQVNKTKESLLNRITELNKKVNNISTNSIKLDEYNDLMYKYDLLLNQFRRINERNKILELRVKKLKEKIY